LGDLGMLSTKCVSKAWSKYSAHKISGQINHLDINQTKVDSNSGKAKHVPIKL
jgi:hypothetical protein